MALKVEHEIHQRRKGRNVGVGLMLGAFVVLVLALTFTKITSGDFELPKANEISQPDDVLEQTIKVRFDASLHSDMDWDFKPEVHEMELRIGETGLAFYEAHNPTDPPIAGQASYNVTPYQAGYFFNKIDCFCFEEQVLQPGETVMMPVSFYVDPEIVTDRDAKYVHTITLSYTFYEIDLPEGFAALDAVTDTTLN